MSAHDTWLAAYYHSVETAYCQTRDCPNADGITVDYEKENGIGWIQPEECPLCNGELSFDRLPEATEDDLSPSDA